MGLSLHNDCIEFHVGGPYHIKGRRLDGGTLLFLLDLQLLLSKTSLHSGWPGAQAGPVVSKPLVMHTGFVMLLEFP